MTYAILPFHQTKMNERRLGPTAGGSHCSGHQARTGFVRSRPLGARPPASPTACSRAGFAVPGEPPVLAPSSAGGRAASNLPAGAGGSAGSWREVTADLARRKRKFLRRPVAWGFPGLGLGFGGMRVAHFSVAVSDAEPQLFSGDPWEEDRSAWAHLGSLGAL